MSKLTKVAVAVAAAMSLSAASAGAQQTANINATADVLTAITVTGAQDLNFGQVLPGVTYPVSAVTDAGAGRFDLSGYGGANVNVSFSALPAALTGPGAPITLGVWTGCRISGPASQTGCVPFTPSGSAEATAFSGGGQLSVYVGNTITPAANQTAGLYTGVITLDAAYF